MANYTARWSILCSSSLEPWLPLPTTVSNYPAMLQCLYPLYPLSPQTTLNHTLLLICPQCLLLPLQVPNTDTKEPPTVSHSELHSFSLSVSTRATGSNVPSLPASDTTAGTDQTTKLTTSSNNHSSDSTSFDRTTDVCHSED